MEAYVTVGAGFLLAVVWFDLMFDVQARASVCTPAAVQSIATYYRRVTTDASPMNRLVVLAMLGTVTAIGFEFAAADIATWVPGISLGLALFPMGIAVVRTVPRAVALGTAAGHSSSTSADAARTPTDEHVAMARMILHEHVLCFGCLALLIGVQLASVA
ncbi:MAG: hypothetical protein JJE46_09090 [Acidimicrobiia bacterium]|nr:hypothetical protein [Acidimicrobiia bacterium]